MKKGKGGRNYVRKKAKRKRTEAKEKKQKKKKKTCLSLEYISLLTEILLRFSSKPRTRQQT